MFRPGDEPVPGYRLEEILGRGGSGEVWRSTAPGETSVALKLISLSGRHGPKEFQAVWRFKEIRHAHLLPITALWLLDRDGNLLDAAACRAFDGGSSPASVSGETSPQPSSRPATLVIAMLLGDKDLADLLQECRRAGMPGIPLGELLDYLEDAAGGIDFLNSPRHDLGAGPVAVQHGDIKPQNIMLVGDSASVCDFGLACVLGEGRTTAAVVGSPAYMSPEIIEGRLRGSTSDQYSLAITYIESRTGSLPIADESCMAVLDAHLKGRLDLSQLPPAEREVIRRATALDPEKRYPTACEMVAALRRAVEPEETTNRHRTVAPTTIDSLRAGKPQLELRGKIGRNAYGTVYRGWDPRMRREVAILELHKKFLRDPEQAQACWTQVTDLAALGHEHIVQVLTGDEVTGRIAMELMQGNLAERLEEGPLAAEFVREVLHQVLQALQFLHTHDRLHGDIRPATILLSSPKKIKLCFSVGIALCGEIPWELRSQKYVAPELLDTKFGRPDPRTDLYSLGFSALELLVGPHFDTHFLRAGESPEEVWADWHGSPSRQLPSAKQLVSDIPDDLARVIDRLLGKHQRQRYRSAQEAQQDLARRHAPAVEATVAKRRSSTVSRYRYIVYLLLLVLLSTAALVGAWHLSSARRLIDITIAVQPTDATILEHETKLVPTAANVYRLTPGQHELTFEREGFLSQTAKVNVTEAGQPVNVHLSEKLAGPTRVDPVAAAAQCDRGIEYLETGKSAEAIVCFDEAIRLDPRCAKAFNNRGIAHSRQDRLDDAITDYTQAIRLEPKEPTPYINRGIAYQLQGKLADAIDDYSGAIGLDPGRPAVYRLRSQAYQEAGQPEKARADESKLAELSETCP